MPFLFLLPMIIFAGMCEVVTSDAELARSLLIKVGE